MCVIVLLLILLLLLLLLTFVLLLLDADDDDDAPLTMAAYQIIDNVVCMSNHEPKCSFMFSVAHVICAAAAQLFRFVLQRHRLKEFINLNFI